MNRFTKNPNPSEVRIYLVARVCKDPPRAFWVFWEYPAGHFGVFWTTRRGILGFFGIPGGMHAAGTCCSSPVWNRRGPNREICPNREISPRSERVNFRCEVRHRTPPPSCITRSRGEDWGNTVPPAGPMAVIGFVPRGGGFRQRHGRRREPSPPARNSPTDVNLLHAVRT